MITRCLEFFDELEIPEPYCFLNAGLSTYVEQTTKSMIKLEKISLKERICIGAVLNEFFNLRSDPIGCSPEDAIQTFIDSDLDGVQL